MNFRALDLNLLRVLDAMLRERNTTRVGERISLSQPAVSSALNRLRAILDDPLFVREGNRMVATPFAASIEEPLTQALGVIEGALSRTPFDPALSTATFRLLGDDFLAEILLPRLMDVLLDHAPGMRFQLLPMNPQPIALQLAEGTSDMAFGPRQPDLPEWVANVFAIHGEPVSVASRTNKRLAAAGIKDGDPIPLDLFCEMPHVKFAPDGAFVGAEDERLVELGRKRRVVLTVPDFFGVAHAVAGSQLTGFLPVQFARAIAGRLGLSVHPSIRLKPIPLHLHWHTRHTDDPEHRWMRERILEILEPLDSVRHPVAGARSAAKKRRLRPRKAVD